MRVRAKKLTRQKIELTKPSKLTRQKIELTKSNKIARQKIELHNLDTNFFFPLFKTDKITR
jgi:hypothetical protein